MKETQGWELEIEGDDETKEIVKSLDMKEEKSFWGSGMVQRQEARDN